MTNLQQYKSAAELIGLWKSLGNKENELKAIADVLRYRDEKEVLDQQIKGLEDSMIPALHAYKKEVSVELFTEQCRSRLDKEKGCKSNCKGNQQCY